MILYLKVNNQYKKFNSLQELNTHIMSIINAKKKTTKQNEQ